MNNQLNSKNRNQKKNQNQHSMDFYSDSSISEEQQKEKLEFYSVNLKNQSNDKINSIEDKIEFCPNCGSEINLFVPKENMDDFVFCPNCGEKINSN